MVNKNTEDSFWFGRKVLVTGATGLVGSWLVKKLNESGADVIVFARDFSPQSELVLSGAFKEIQRIHGDLTCFRTIERAVTESECEIILHLGAQAIVSTGKRSPLLTFEANIRGTYNLLEAARVHRDYVNAVVVASSDKAYGKSDKLPYLEEMPLAGTEPYEVSKTCADLLSTSYFKSFDLPVAVARCGNIYGGGDLNFSRLVPGTIRSLLLGDKPIIRSDGSFIRDYIYVKDVVAAYLALAEAVAKGAYLGEAFNFSPERPVGVLELVLELQKKLGVERLQPIIQNTATGEIHSQALDSTKARQNLGWKPHYTLEKGLAETIDWYRKFLASRPRQGAVSGK
jgi:CDP-glucose 4,6-dehydratase